MPKSGTARRRTLLAWAKDLAPVALGAAMGLVAAVILFGGDDTPPPAKPQERAVAERPSVTPRPTERVVPFPIPPFQPRQSAVPAPRAASPAVPPAANPAVRRDAPAWKRFAAPHAPVAGRPMIAILIDDMGVDRKRSDRMAALPGPLTLAYLTYGRDLGQQTAAARARGHELMVHVPMEPENGTADAGPNALRSALGSAELARRIDWALTRFDGFVGVNNHMGSRFTTDAAGMALVMDALARHGLLFVDSRTTPRTAGPRLAREHGVPFAERSVFLDNEEEAAGLRARLAETERAARATGYALAIGHPRDATITALAAWLPGLSDRGFALVPVSAIVRHRQDMRKKTAGRP